MSVTGDKDKVADGDLRILVATDADPHDSDALAAFLRLPFSFRARRLPTSCGVTLEEERLLRDLGCDTKDGEGDGTGDGAKAVAVAVAMRGDAPSARCALFSHDGEPDVGYVGMFEAEPGGAGAMRVLSAIEEAASGLGMVRLVGPVDRTIWERYRFKVAGFDDTYTGDPSNPSVYPHLWEQAGFSVRDSWRSDVIEAVSDSKTDKMACRLRRAEEMGYVLRHVTRTSFKSDAAAIHRLVSDLYSGFPAFTPRQWDDFWASMSPMRLALDLSATVIAESTDGEAVGFLVAVPDYASAKGLLAKVGMRTRPARYVILYMGVAKGHEGLGAAMMAVLRRRVVEVGASSVAALIHDGKASGAYLTSLGASHRFRYSLYEKDIEKDVVRRGA